MGYGLCRIDSRYVIDGCGRDLSIPLNKRWPHVVVDASYAPFFQRFGYMEEVLKSGVLDGFPKVKAWAKTLVGTEAIKASTVANFKGEFVNNLRRRKLWAANLFEGQQAAE